jgi:hypothetical protein
MGYIPPWKPGSAPQNLTVSRACARAAVAFAREQYGVFIDGVIGPVHLDTYVEELREAAVPIHYAVLLPPVDVIQRRARDRDKVIAGLPRERAGQAEDDMFARVHSIFTRPDATQYWTIDNTSLTAHETADRVMDACGTGEALVWSPEQNREPRT